MLRIITIITLSIFFAHTKAQEIKNNMPIYINNMLQQHTYTLDPNNYKNTQKWKKAAKKQLLQATKLPIPDTTLTYHITDTQQRQGYKIHKINYTLSAWNQGKAYLLIPDNTKKAPAILMLHDHGAHFTIGKEKLAKPFNTDTTIIKNAQTWVKKYYNNTFLADHYAQKGYIVLVADALLWGERQAEQGTQHHQQQAIAAGLIQLGYTLPAIMLHDDIRTLQLLCSLPYVDTKKIGCLGFSMGAYRAWMLSAATTQITATAAICWMTTTKHQLTPPMKPKGNSDYNTIIPALAQKLDYPHIAALTSPRPLLLFNGTKDKLFPIEGVKQAYQIIENIYKKDKATHNLNQQLWDTTHTFTKEQQQATLQFFQQHLQTP